ncbi:pitrilysin family protein [Pseudoroseomonas cervicalis]|uniref:M16 family metallopeptidase n=1 Tax=Teichococcus cervicalis TaxID=204525 RepID=UPI0022F16E8C|nr:pitrilysin family protein [Pseudoroseomonas cervicalis]WBV43632.1 pitrilysin family protein [Pseudoroseomonas cervicalis]
MSGNTTPPPAGGSGFSLPIQVVEGGGFTAWLAEDHSVPVVSLAWSWPGGAALDPAGQEGASALAAGLLTEGAGELDALAFADALRDEGIGLDFGADRDSFSGSLRALAPALPEAVRLARLAMTAPRLAEPDVARLRARAIARARQSLEGPRGRAARAFWAEAYPDHPAGRPAGGTEESLAALTVEQLRAALARPLHRGPGLLIAASGAIDAAGLARLLPELFGALPEGAVPAAPPLPEFRRFGTQVVPVAAPQSTILFGQQGIPVTDPEWETAQIVLRILSGGGFTARLTRSIREARGLTYGISAGLDSIFAQSVLVGGFATANARVGEALSLLREEWKRMADAGPEASEMEEAVAYMTGSQPLQFTDSRRIAATLLAMRRNGRPLDWLEQRPARLAAVTQPAAAKLAARLLVPDQLSITVAGQPEGL